MEVSVSIYGNAFKKWKFHFPFMERHSKNGNFIFHLWKDFQKMELHVPFFESGSKNGNFAFHFWKVVQKMEISMFHFWNSVPKMEASKNGKNDHSFPD